MFTLTVTQDAANKFQEGIDQEGLDSSPGILVKTMRRGLDYGITNASSRLSSSTISRVLFYFSADLPDEVWNVDHDGINYISTETPR